MAMFLYLYLGSRLAILRPIRTVSSLASRNPSAPIREMLSSPTWSVRSLCKPEPLADQSPPPATETISSTQLRQLLRLAALPPPKSEQEEQAMIVTLESQLRFVRAVQSIDTTGVEPLCRIGDETPEGVAERTIKLSDLRSALDNEVPVGHHKRSTRDRSKTHSESEDWDVLAAASRKAGRYFVVDCGKGNKDST
ncbi:hypothetical protein XA68_17411 [Ophiocordyceps unilateralis]|uniref:Glutamyl-tRNA amidotransferase complex subunit Gta3 domain-containing protein n=1 Tax=Ophiocordyceps unilateralis TaxID=268505 RepID=A0A2A9PIV5_OPHUN|nr:hypothetical protein XA68_17411 [Ophiocordyceps unilateralis]